MMFARLDLLKSKLAEKLIEQQDINFNEPCSKRQYRKIDNRIVKCNYCLEIKNFIKNFVRNNKLPQNYRAPIIHSSDLMPKSYYLYIIIINDKEFLRCENCNTIQCYDCFRFVVLDRKSVKKNCNTCKYRKDQEQKLQEGSKECECSKNCHVQIPLDCKYAHGHNLKSEVRRRRKRQFLNEQYEKMKY